MPYLKIGDIVVREYTVSQFTQGEPVPRWEVMNIDEYYYHLFYQDEHFSGTIETLHVPFDSRIFEGKFVLVDSFSTFQIET